MGATYHERAVGVLKSGVRREDRVVGFNDGGGHGGRRVHAELELRLLTIVGRESLEDQRSETGTGSTAKGVEHEEALKTAAVVGQPPNPVHHDIDLLLANGVMTTGVCAPKN